MTGQWRYALLSARLLRGARAHISPQRSSSPDHTIAMLAGVITVAATRRRRRRALGLAAGATGTLGLAVLFALGLKGTASLSTAASVEGAAPANHRFFAEGSTGASVMPPHGEIQPLLVGQEWHDGEFLRSDALPVALNGADGTTLEIDPGSELQLVRGGPQRWFRLERGGVSAHVTKLKPGERFVMATPDAEVEVRGTRFHVTVVSPDQACGQGVVTRVSVSEGVVVVRSLGHEARVDVGHHWPLGCPDRSLSPVVPAPARASVSVKYYPARASSAKAASEEIVSASTLATENDLFSSALKAGRAGDRREAVELLNVLLARFPNSPLKQSAESARLKLSELIQPAQ